MKFLRFFFALSIVFSMPLFANDPNSLKQKDIILLQAVRSGNLDNVKKAVENGGDVNLTIAFFPLINNEYKIEGYSVLQLAEEKGNQEIINYLIEQIGLHEQKNKK